MNSPDVAPETVSVIIPAYNAAQYINETLSSVVRQSYPKVEIIVINDGSSDTPILKEVITPFLERIVYVEQENRGPSAARNVGILRSRGEYVAFLDSDDFWLPEYLAFQMELFQQSPPPDVVYTDGLIIGDTRPASDEDTSIERHPNLRELVGRKVSGAYIRYRGPQESSDRSGAF